LRNQDLDHEQPSQARDIEQLSSELKEQVRRAKQRISERIGLMEDRPFAEPRQREA
jgi:hypothetical protein